MKLTSLLRLPNYRGNKPNWPVNHDLREEFGLPLETSKNEKNPLFIQ